MRIAILLLSILLGFSSIAQTIDYSLPQGFDKTISEKDYKTIVDLSLPIIGRHCTVTYVKEGTVHVKQGADTGALNLDNLILKCLDEKDKSLWHDVVLQHMNNLFSSFDEQNNMDTKNFDSMSKYLSLRIYTNESVAQRGGADNLITQVDIDGTYTVLMLDLANAFTPVPKDAFTAWGKDIDSIFKIAQNNVDKQKVEKATKTINVEGVDVEMNFIGNEDYAASYALDMINNSPEFVGEWGACVCIPNKGVVNSCKITKDKPLDFVKFIQGTRAINEQAYTTHAQPISDQYFWYYRDRFIKINVSVKPDGGGLNVVAPAGLTELMEEK